MPYSEKRHGKAGARRKASDASLASYYRCRAAVIGAYGNQCACCGEKEIEFLQVDHVNNDGAVHRKQLKTAGGSQIYRDIIRRNFPDDFQLLCANCHLVKSCGRVCPHKR